MKGIGVTSRSIARFDLICKRTICAPVAREGKEQNQRSNSWIIATIKAKDNDCSDQGGGSECV
jgi:hypothetical protein